MDGPRAHLLKVVRRGSYGSNIAENPCLQETMYLVQLEILSWPWTLLQPALNRNIIKIAVYILDRVTRWNLEACAWHQKYNLNDNWRGHKKTIETELQLIIYRKRKLWKYQPLSGHRCRYRCIIGNGEMWLVVLLTPSYSLQGGFPLSISIIVQPKLHISTAQARSGFISFCITDCMSCNKHMLLEKAQNFSTFCYSCNGENHKPQAPSSMDYPSMRD